MQSDRDATVVTVLQEYIINRVSREEDFSDGGKGNIIVFM